MKHLLPIILLTGCATTPPAMQLVTQRVEVPISVPCATATPLAPDYCFKKLTTADDIFNKTKCLLSDRQLSIGYETELTAALQSCK